MFEPAEKDLDRLIDLSWENRRKSIVVFLSKVKIDLTKWQTVKKKGTIRTGEWIEIVE